LKNEFTVVAECVFVHSARIPYVEFHPGRAQKLSTFAECTVNKLLMMDRETFRNM